ncbi:hypothetical protein GWI33_014883 [Rhynchophorus ferrugineus]|uniref:C2H2-type domain-containing protein n=1 Tax=Rhynchophorus ferrugineus TaxID=354439 RepID=A0A834I1R7_RHYFE|nr:hypothetical protein GWI33_014883 [Rhynchophorus ferrugineus]
MYINTFFILGYNDNECDMCGRIYLRKSSLRRHQRMECGVEPQYQCPSCYRKFKHEHHLEQHCNAKIKCTEDKFKPKYIRGVRPHVVQIQTKYGEIRPFY